MSENAALPLTKEEKLGMLGLAKQGTFGDVSEAKPGKFDVKVGGRGRGTAGGGGACVWFYGCIFCLCHAAGPLTLPPALIAGPRQVGGVGEPQGDGAGRGQGGTHQVRAVAAAAAAAAAAARSPHAAPRAPRRMVSEVKAKYNA